MMVYPKVPVRRPAAYTVVMSDDEIEALDEAEPGDEPSGAIGKASTPARASAPSAMSRRAYFDRVVAGVRGDLASELREFQARSYGHLLKIHYENERVHYEVWPDSQRGTIEIGLHFEDGPVSTAAYLRYFDARIVELKHVLGAEVELERWTVSWGHIYYLIPLLPLNGAKATESAQLLAKLIMVLEPLVRAAGVSRERVDLPTERRRFQRRARS